MRAFGSSFSGSAAGSIIRDWTSWSMDEAMAFYRDRAGFAPARVEAEVVRNSMMPSSRAMYWLGVEGIKALRRRWKGDTLSFHDTLLSFGAVPLSWIAEEMDRAGLLNPGPSFQ